MNKIGTIVISIFLLLGLATVISGCDGILGDEEPNPDIYFSTNSYEPAPYEIISFWSDDGLSTQNEFNGTFGELDIIAVQTEPGILSIMIPDLPQGSYNLTIDLGDRKGIIDLSISSPNPVNNPEEVINNIVSEANQSLQSLETISAETGQPIGENDKILLSNTLDELNSAYATLSASEKQQVASFIMANPEMFNNDYFKSVSSELLLEGFKDYMSQNMIKIMLAGSTFYLSFSAPEPTGVTKFIALAAGAYLFKKVLDLKMHILQIYSESVVLESSDITERSEFVFLNHEEIIFDVKISKRTMYKGDVSTTIMILQEVISLIDNYLDFWNTVDGYIIKFKNLFNISGGGLSNSPRRVSEIETYTSEEIDGNGKLVEIENITNSNVKVAITSREEGWIIARFSSCENEYQNFGFTYAYNDPMVEDKDYEALLVATEIIYNEITDPRDGKVYNTIDIGNQTWFAQNLNYWGQDSNLGICDSNDLTGEINGRYYDFYDAEEACPPGWHLPSDDEWTQFELALGMDPADIDKFDDRGESIGLASILKSCDAGWIYYNTSTVGINSVGFSIIPSSYISTHLAPYALGGYGHRADFWSSSNSTNSFDKAFIRSLHYSQSGFRRDTYEKYYHKLTVRCVRD